MSPFRALGLVTAAAVLWMTSAVRADTIIGSSPYNVNGNLYLPNSPNSGPRTAGQTFTVGADNVLTSFSFYGLWTADYEYVYLFDFKVMEWDSGNRQPAGAPLVHIANNPMTSNFTSKPKTFSDLRLSLVAGKTYVAFVETLAGGFKSPHPNGMAAVGVSNPGIYAGGSYVYLNSGSSSGRWSTESSTDLAFSASFTSPTVPLPGVAWSALALLGGMALQQALRRRPR